MAAAVVVVVVVAIVVVVVAAVEPQTELWNLEAEEAAVELCLEQQMKDRTKQGEEQRQMELQ